MSRRRTPRHPCQQRSLRHGAPYPAMRDGWRSRNFCNHPTTHKVRWFAGFVTVGDGFEEERREVWKPMVVRVCETHARRIQRWQTSIDTRVGVYRYRSVR